MDNLEFNFFFKLCGQLVVVIFIQDKIANLLSSKQGNAHNLIHTLSNKTLNLCSILKIKTGYVGPSAKVQSIRLQCTRQGTAKIDYCGCHLIFYLVVGSQRNITHGTGSLVLLRGMAASDSWSIAVFFVLGGSFLCCNWIVKL